MSHSFRTLDRVSQSNVDPNGLYKYSSRPRLVEVRCKPRQPPVFHHVLRPAKQTQQQYGNIMYDHRVVRGIAQHIIPSTSQPGSAEIQRQSSIRRGGAAGRRAMVQLGPRTPEPVQGRQHIDVQTDLYLEELSEVIATTDTESQTDEFLDRPATPLFIPVKSGKDAETQIEEGELFDFDSEVQPVLEVLVGKTIEQSLLEVMEEEELASLRAQQKAFRELRNNELAEVQRLQEQERRLTEEKKRRIAQQKEMLMIERETVEKVNALEFSQQYLADLLPAVFSSLRRQGVFYDPVEKEIENNFFSWLMAEVHNKIENRNTVRMLLDTIIYEACENGLKEIKAFWKRSQPESIHEEIFGAQECPNLHKADFYGKHDD